MASAAVLQRLAQRAKQAEDLVTQLKAQVELVRKAAALSVSKPEEERISLENEQLRAKITTLKASLVLAEIKNGVKQIPLPKKRVVVKCEAVQDAPATPAVQDTKSAQQKQTNAVKPEAKDQAASKPKKAKTDNKKDAAADADRPVDISRIDMRVGKIVGVKKHPDADSLYVEEVDLGEGQPRTIVSGLVKHVPIEEMQDRLAVFMCNLKPAKMRGIMSHGMIMCASAPEKVEILLPPAGACIGDKVIAKDFTDAPDALLNPKKKIWETVKPDLRTDAGKIAAYKGSQLAVAGKGPVLAPTMPNTQIS